MTWTWVFVVVCAALFAAWLVSWMIDQRGDGE